jgi:hypothetical protein
MPKALIAAVVVWLASGTLAGSWSSALTRQADAMLPRAASRSVMLARQSIVNAPAAHAQPAVPALTGEPATYRKWLDRYCVGCHNSRSAFPTTEPVNLESVTLTDLTSHAETWERVLRKLAVRAMPPQGMPRPTEADYAAFTGWLSRSLDRAGAARSHAGRFVVHRLNRGEYANAVRDLLGVDVDVTELLPSDGGDFGFDNIATALRTSPLLLERYLTAAQRISTMAVGDATAEAGAAEYAISLETSQRDHVDGLPLGTRGGIVVRHVFPADGEYVFSARLVRGVEEGYVGMEGHDTPHTFVVTIDGEEVFSASVGGPDDHVLNGRRVNEARIAMDERLRGRVAVTAGAHAVGFTWRDRPQRAQDVWQPSLRDTQEVHHVGGLPRLRRVNIEGPYNATGVAMTPSRQKIFVCQPTAPADEPACARRIVSNLSRLAYRRPVTEADIEAPLAFYRQTREQGRSFDAAIRAGVARIIASPSFLYRLEGDPATVPAGAAHPVTDLELASRLSFFLWSSIPDDELLRLAERNQLRRPGVLVGQVRRMVADARADAMMQNITGQWLQLRNLESRVTPDLLLFPDFDDNVRQAFRRETELFFGYIVRENRSALELLNADYTFLNERLARHYGITGVYGTRFRRVSIEDPNRRGLLGHGSILSLTSVATRTSPVLRGKYVLSQFFNTPPPPPPPVVPTLEESKGTADAPRTVRQQLELHRANPVCASCHRMIDPVGFALENFNPVGQWREVTAEGAPVDSAAVLSDGSQVDSPADLRDVILSRPDAFATILTERMMTYALGRGLEPSDMAVVRAIVRRAAENEYSFHSILLGIVESVPFQMRTKLVDPGTPVENRVTRN